MPPKLKKIAARDEAALLAGLTVRTHCPEYMQAMRIEAQILAPPRSYAPIWQSQHNPITAIKIQVRAVIAKYYELYPEATVEEFKKNRVRMDEFERLKTADDIRTWLNWLKDDTLKEHIVGELEAFAPFHEVRRCTI